MYHSSRPSSSPRPRYRPIGHRPRPVHANRSKPPPRLEMDPQQHSSGGSRINTTTTTTTNKHDDNHDSNSTEAELESFRRQWREEVTARTKGKAQATSSSAKVTDTSSKPRSHVPHTAPFTHIHTRQRSVEESDEVTPHIYQNLGEKQHGRRLDKTGAQTAAAFEANQEPNSALEHYEKAVEKESQGSLGDSVSLYRKAFRLDSRVHETYKAKHFPPSYFIGKGKPSATTAVLPTPNPAPQVAKTVAEDRNPSHASTSLSSTAHHSLHGLSPAVQTLVHEASALRILGEAPPTDLSPAPPCPISHLPEEILVEILIHLAVKDFASFVHLAQVCKRLAYLTTTEDRIWKRITLGHEYGFAAMHYTWSCEFDGTPLGDLVLGLDSIDISDSEDLSPSPASPSPLSLTRLLVPSTYPNYRTLFQRRPRIRFNGCYISTVNYMRPGQASPTSLTWNSPIHIVTYYRYLRFLRDGTCISLLTTSEPADVVPYLYTENMHKNHGSLPTAPIKDAVLGRWRLSGPCIPHAGLEQEAEGTLMIETAGATPKYMYKMALTIGHAGRASKNNKLSWQGYWSYNRLSDDWGEFGLKNDKPFYWSRVKSYGMAWGEAGMKKM
ncbi:hypothetical protein IAQ61_010156, partial [Plenodomus lingam]|uniref:uncharacterized protein n=1 Tax=Leptosphaeria maculans TaxID=5022 RepID=UPI00332A66A0